MPRVITEERKISHSLLFSLMINQSEEAEEAEEAEEPEEARRERERG